MIRGWFACHERGVPSDSETACAVLEDLTAASCRDTFRLLLAYATRQLARRPTDLSVADIDADLVAGFLAFVEDDRKNTIRTRNVRRAAIRSFFRFVAIREPALLLHCQRVLAIPAKRQAKRTVDFLEREEAAALLAMPRRASEAGACSRSVRCCLCHFQPPPIRIPTARPKAYIHPHASDRRGGSLAKFRPEAPREGR